MNRGALVGYYDGRLALVISDVATVEALAGVLERVGAQTRWKTGVDLEVASVVVPHARAFLAFTSLEAVPATEPQRDDGGPVTGSWISTRQAAELLGIGERAVRKRIANGDLPARNLGPQWLIDPTELTA